MSDVFEFLLIWLVPTVITFVFDFIKYRERGIYSLSLILSLIPILSMITAFVAISRFLYWLEKYINDEYINT